MATKRTVPETTTDRRSRGRSITTVAAVSIAVALTGAACSGSSATDPDPLVDSGGVDDTTTEADPAEAPVEEEPVDEPVDE